MRILAPISLVLALACGITRAQATRTVTVFAAASLTESMRDIATQFESANPGVKIEFNFAGSQDLVAEMENGAGADLFASANETQMDKAAKEGLVDPASIHGFAGNHLVVVVPKDNPAKIEQIADLAKPGIKIVVADKAVPVGKYTQQMLDQMSKDPAYGPDFEKGFLANVVSREENVKSVLSKVRLGEADAGVVYETDLTKDAEQDVQRVAVPDKFNQLATYPIAVAAKSSRAQDAEKFEDFVMSDEGRKILRDYGFLPPPASKP
jgi:molybdate transport system substrate-binding protein